MTVIHIGKFPPGISCHPTSSLTLTRYLFVVLFKFRSSVSAAHKSLFVSELKTLKSLPSVQDGRLIVGGPSITDPIEKSKGFEFALLSYHRDREALAEYQASQEHHRYILYSRCAGEND